MQLPCNLWVNMAAKSTLSLPQVRETEQVVKLTKAGRRAPRASPQNPARLRPALLAAQVASLSASFGSKHVDKRNQPSFLHVRRSISRSRTPQSRADLSFAHPKTKEETHRPA